MLLTDLLQGRSGNEGTTLMKARDIVHIRNRPLGSQPVIAGFS
jgi:hypothetical protein